MSAVLAGHVADYLRLRRALGFKLTRPGLELPQFVAYLDTIGAQSVTVEAAIAWTRLSAGAQPVTLSHRLGAVRGFARYLATIDPATEIPPCGLFGKQQRRTPYIYSPEEITGLLTAAGRLRPRLRAATYQALLGLLAATGMRVGEAVRLTGSDVDLDTGVLRVRHAKFDRERLVPLHPSVTAALTGYTSRRDRLAPAGRADTLFVTTIGTPLNTKLVNATFGSLLAAAGLPSTPGQRPRVHDIRHRFVVDTLIGWHREGVDVAARLPVLSTYLGHVSPASTYWYFSAVPELMQLAAAGLDRRSGSRP
jgi:integrase/recombinase XerD